MVLFTLDERKLFDYATKVNPVQEVDTLCSGQLLIPVFFLTCQRRKGFELCIYQPLVKCTLGGFGFRIFNGWWLGLC